MAPVDWHEQGAVVAAYLHALETGLRGPAVWKRRVLAEIEDGLLSEVATTSAPAQEVMRAWGAPGMLAAQFNETWRLTRARTMARRILQCLPAVVIGWALVVALSPDPWPHEPVLIEWVAPVLFACLIFAVCGSIQLIRRRSPAMLAAAYTYRSGVVVVCSGIAIGTACLVVLLVFRLQASGGHIFWGGTIVAGLLTLALLALVVDGVRLLSIPARR